MDAAIALDQALQSKSWLAPQTLTTEDSVDWLSRFIWRPQKPIWQGPREVADSPILSLSKDDSQRDVVDEELLDGLFAEDELVEHVVGVGDWLESIAQCSQCALICK